MLQSKFCNFFAFDAHHMLARQSDKKIKMFQIDKTELTEHYYYYYLYVYLSVMVWYSTTFDNIWKITGMALRANCADKRRARLFDLRHKKKNLHTYAMRVRLRRNSLKVVINVRNCVIEFLISMNIEFYAGKYVFRYGEIGYRPLLNNKISFVYISFCVRLSWFSTHSSDRNVRLGFDSNDSKSTDK